MSKKALASPPEDDRPDRPQPQGPGTGTVTISGTTYIFPFVRLTSQLTKETCDRLNESIKKRRIQAPIIVNGRTYESPDGFYRLRAAAELGFGEDQIPFDSRDDLTPEKMRELAETLNYDRRHLDTAQKRECAARLLRDDPARADRSIARAIGIDNKTVASVRRELEAAGELQPSRSGREKPRAPKPSTPGGRDSKANEPTPGAVTPEGESDPPPAASADTELDTESAGATVDPAPVSVTPTTGPAPTGVAQAPVDATPPAPNQWKHLDRMATTLDQAGPRLRRVRRTPAGRRDLGVLRRVLEELDGVRAALAALIAHPPEVAEQAAEEDTAA